MIDSPPTRASVGDAHPVTGPERLPPEVQSHVVWWFVLGAIVAALLVLVSRRRRVLMSEPTPEEWGRQQLANISTANGDAADLGELLSGIVRGYIERRHRISVAEKTTAEVATALRLVGMNDSQISGCCDLLDRCDLAKFVRQSFTVAESAETLRRAQTLLSSSLPLDESSTTAKAGKFR